jgi:hypothetical protein
MSKNSKATVLITGNGLRTKELMKYIIEHPEEIQVEVKTKEEAIQKVYDEGNAIEWLRSRQ